MWNSFFTNDNLDNESSKFSKKGISNHFKTIIVLFRKILMHYFTFWLLFKVTSIKIWFCRSGLS